MRAILAASLLMVSLVDGRAVAAACPPGALGVARTIVVDPREHARIGAMQYNETLPLNDREVVLTPPMTGRCRVIPAAFSRRWHPNAPRRPSSWSDRWSTAIPPWCVASTTKDTRSRTTANYSFTFSRMSVPEAGGADRRRVCLAACGARRSRCGRSVLPHSRPVAAGLGRAVSRRAWRHDLERRRRGRRLDAYQRRRVARRAVSRLEARGKGVLLLHDIHEGDRRRLAGDPPGAQGAWLQDRSRGAGGAGPAEDRDHARAMGGARGAGARTSAARDATDMATSAPALTVPSPASFGVADPSGLAVAVCAPGFDHMPLQPGAVSPPPVAPRPRPNFSAPSMAGSFAVPAAQNFQYAHVFAGPRRDTTARAARKRVASSPANGVRAKASNRPAQRVTSPFGGLHRVAAAAVRSPVVGHARTPPSLAAVMARAARQNRKGGR